MKKAAHGAKGFKTEELIRRYFLQSGFFVLRGIRLAYEGDDLTDIDIWVYERSATLARRRTIIDIKDKAKPQAAERLFFALGVSKLLGVEGVGVATTDSRPALRTLAQKNKVLWINGEDIKRLKQSPSISKIQRLSEEDLHRHISALDKSRGGKHAMSQYETAKSSIADRFGVSSANRCLDAARHFADQTIRCHPGSEQAETLGRLTYVTAALCAASFDFASADTALRPIVERRKSMVNSIQFGSDGKSFEERVEWTETAIREYAPNGKVVAKAVRDGIFGSVTADSADDLADIVVKLSHDNRLFDAARFLEMAAYTPNLPTFDQLPNEAQSFLGALLDYSKIERKRFRQSWSSKTEFSPEKNLQKHDDENNSETVEEENKRQDQPSLL